MNSKEELIRACERILWLENQMRDNYAMYAKYVKDEDLLRAFKEIENDEIRHINMSQRILAILRK